MITQVQTTAEYICISPYRENSPEKSGISIQTQLKAVEFVRKLGIRSNLSGYHLLVSSISMALDDPDLLLSFTNSLYPAVAKRHGSNVKAVEKNMRRAIDSAYEYDPERIREIFYYKVGKPYISEVISLAVETIIYEELTEQTL